MTPVSCPTTAYNLKQLGEQQQELCYHFELQGVATDITVTLTAEHNTVPSITPLFANADWHEREMMELYGIRVANQPNRRRLFLDEELDVGILNEAVPLSIMMNGACTTDLWGTHSERKGRGTRMSKLTTFNMPLGPVHVALEEPVYFNLTVEGETIRKVELTSGHVHRGMEALATQRNLIKNVTLTERVCSLCSNSHSFTYSMAVENVLGMDIPVRARYLRVLAEEIKRVASHLFNTAIQAHIIGFKSLFMHVMEVREMMQDVKETVYGNRMNLASNCIGGVKCDVPPDMLKYILERSTRWSPPWTRSARSMPPTPWSWAVPRAWACCPGRTPCAWAWWAPWRAVRHRHRRAQGFALCGLSRPGVQEHHP